MMLPRHDLDRTSGEEAGSCARATQHGFALVDLTVVLTIAVMLSALLLSGLQHIRQRADRTTCSNNLKQIGYAVHACQDCFGRLPPAIGGFPQPTVNMYERRELAWPDCWGCKSVPAQDSAGQQSKSAGLLKPNGNAFGTIQFHLLPFVGEYDLYQQTDPGGTNHNPQKNNWNFDGKNYVSRKSLPVYTCPSDPSVSDRGSCLLAEDWGAGCYADNFQVFAPSGNWGGYARLPATFRDGISNTILFAERYASCDDKISAWAYQQPDRNAAVFAVWSRGPASAFQTQPSPWDTECDASAASSSHRGGMNVSLGDGSVRFLADSIAGRNWWAMCVPADGKVSGDFYRE